MYREKKNIVNCLSIFKAQTHTPTNDTSSKQTSSEEKKKKKEENPPNHPFPLRIMYQSNNVCWSVAVAYQEVDRLLSALGNSAHDGL